MKNIHEILKSVGIEVPADKKEAFDKEVLENYKTVSEVNLIRGKLENAESERDTYKNKYDEDIKKRDADLEDLQKKLKNAGVDAEKLKTLETDLATLKTTYEESKGEYEKKLADQAYEFALKRKVDGLKFSSNSAKKAFIADAMKEEMKIKDGELQGFDSFVKSYKENDAGAFISEEPNKQDPPHFSGKSTGTDSQQKADNQEKTSRPLIW